MTGKPRIKLEKPNLKIHVACEFTIDVTCEFTIDVACEKTIAICQFRSCTRSALRAYLGGTKNSPEGVTIHVNSDNAGVHSNGVVANDGTEIDLEERRVVGRGILRSFES